MGGKHCRGLDLVCINGMEVQVFRDDRTNESGLNAAGGTCSLRNLHYNLDI